MDGTTRPEAVRTEGLRKVFGRGDPTVTALDGIDLTVPPGTVFGLLGANGSGKSTLIRVLTTLAAPTAGRAWVDGHDVVATPGRVRAAIGVTAQQTTLDQRLSGRENLMVFGRLCGLPRAESRARASELLDRYDLAAAADRPVSTYSGGMRRRLDIISSLILRPSLLFLDEPTTGLDPHSRNDIWCSVTDLAGGGTTVFLTTQYLEEADRVSHQVAVLRAGRVIAAGTPRDLKQRIGLRLELTLTEPGDRQSAADVLERLGTTDLISDGENRTLRGVVAAGTATLPEILNALNADDIGVADVGLHEPTLDEAYLALTGAAA